MLAVGGTPKGCPKPIIGQHSFTYKVVCGNNNFDTRTWSFKIILSVLHLHNKWDAIELACINWALCNSNYYCSNSFMMKFMLIVVVIVHLTRSQYHLPPVIVSKEYVGHYVNHL